MVKNILEWFGLSRTNRSPKSQQRSAFKSSRRLRHEQLEDRRMLATLTVSTHSDSGVVPVNDGILHLREAIAYVNNTVIPGAVDRNAWIDESVDLLGTNDTILFALPAGEDRITLAHGELTIRKSVTIDAEGQGITVDASGNDPTPMLNNGDGSRVLAINMELNPEPRAVTLAGLTITGGDNSGNGGGLYFDSSAFPSGDVTLTPY